MIIFVVAVHDPAQMPQHALLSDVPEVWYMSDMEKQTIKGQGTQKYNVRG